MVDEHSRWGAQCSCHEAERREGTSVVMWQAESGANAVFLARVGSHEWWLNLDEVEGDQALLLKTLTILRRFRSDARQDEVALGEFHVCSRLRRVMMRTRTILSLVNSWQVVRPIS